MKITFPHPLIILLGFIFLAAIATYLIPSGSFERVLNEETGREVVVPGSFQSIEDINPTLNEILLAIPEGIIAGADIIVLILFIGGAFYVVEKTGALQAGIEALIYRFRNSRYLLFYLLGTVFAFGGATMSMQEEIIPMVPILVILASKLHYDLRAIVAITLGSALLGGAFSPMNPFVSLLAQKVGEVEPFSGALYRSIFFLIALGSWITFHMVTGKKSKATQENIEFKPSPISNRQLLILAISFGGIGFMSYGITSLDWGYNEMSALFFVIGMTCGIIGKMGLNGTSKTYVQGFGEMIFAGIIVGLARSIYLVLEKGAVIDPIIQGLFSPLEDLPNSLAVTGMFISQALIHIPVPSTSGQAVLTIPLAAPLTDLLGIGRQVAVLGYQYPAALMDMLTPTNGGMMAVIAAGGINYKDWISYIWKSWVVLAIFALGITLLGILWFS
ncbi:putative ion transporter superfamily protein YfcC [Algoriphagus boseongensis]|uniref:Putative ion transporter superfamily protein YfcC n=1 Tax=Algoriphagus boseongensis TaxID=1442587 RepID=A0A4R6TAJ0_9BACT|nr:Na+/H+ antiporter NhaC family protein [Algoriphagus boseongensis]TDQ18645.1 putative ion transporter superfamily protein YfcC [Algoriphagus boseongensis]